MFYEVFNISRKLPLSENLHFTKQFNLTEKASETLQGNKNMTYDSFFPQFVLPNAGNKYFLLFQQCFLSLPKQPSISDSDLFVCKCFQNQLA